MLCNARRAGPEDTLGKTQSSDPLGCVRYDHSTFAPEVLNLVATLVTRTANITAANMPVPLHIFRPLLLAEPVCHSQAQSASSHDEKPSFPIASTKLCVNLLLTP